MKHTIGKMLGATGMIGLLAYSAKLMDRHPVHQDANAYTCPHCGWLGAIVFSAWFRDGRLRLVFDRHPDLRNRSTVCLLNGTVSYDASLPDWLSPYEDDPDVRSADHDGFVGGMIFRLLEQNTDVRPPTLSVAEMATAAGLVTAP